MIYICFTVRNKTIIGLKFVDTTVDILSHTYVRNKTIIGLKFYEITHVPTLNDLLEIRL